MSMLPSQSATLSDNTPRAASMRVATVARAAEVAAMFEGGRARFAGAFPALEDELVGLSYDQPYQGPGRSGSRSPDRADAMVWTMRELMPGVARQPGVRSL